MKKQKIKNTKGWGTKTESGEEMWDDRPVFEGEQISIKDKIKLLFYPKKLYLYSWVSRYVRRHKSSQKNKTLKIVDVGCGTGATVIDFKKMFKRNAEIIGVDVMSEQIDIAKKRIKEYGVWSEFHLYDGENLPFSDNSIDIIYSSDVLGHVKDVRLWLQELYRVLKPNGEIIMFSESKLGKHAYIRNYLLSKNINTDPHAEFHISLYSKSELKDKLINQGFIVKTMISVFLAKFFVHPEELYLALQNTKNNNKHTSFIITFLRISNQLLYLIKNSTKPISLIFSEFYGLIEMTVFGRFFESQGYLIRAIKITEAVKSEENKSIDKFTPLEVEYSAVVVED